MKEMGLSRSKWTSPGWPGWLLEVPPPAPCHVCGPQAQARWTTTAGERLGDRHMSGGRRPLGPANANGGVTEHWGKAVLRIKEDLHCMVVQSSSLYHGHPHCTNPPVSHIQYCLAV